MTIWMDVTNSLVLYSGNAVSIIRIELMLAKMLHKVCKNIRFSVMTEDGFREVDPLEIDWLWKSNDLFDDYLKYQASKEKISKKYAYKFRRHKEKSEYKQKRHELTKNLIEYYLPNPYKNGDTVYSCGWYGSDKEKKFEAIKKFYPDLKLVYTVYDLAMLKNELKAYYPVESKKFEAYLGWIAKNCTSVIYGGETTHDDARNYFGSRGVKISKGYSIKWGTDTKKEKSNTENDKCVLKKLNINTPYLLSVGTLDWKKNYKVLYQAYCMLCLKETENIPNLVIVGGRLKTKLRELRAVMLRNPLLKDKVKILNCSDDELNVLYRNCEYTLLPSLYAGWSLALSESFSYNKFALCADVNPLRETGDGFAEFLNPNHPKDWANKIEYYSRHPEEIKKAEENLKQNWKPISWYESAETLYERLKEISATNYVPGTDEPEDNFDLAAALDNDSEPRIYYDYSLIDYPKLSGVPRAQIILGRELYKLKKNITFYYVKGSVEYYEIPTECLKHTLNDGNIDESVKKDLSGLEFKPKKILPFKKNDVVISLGMHLRKNFIKAHKEIGFKYISTIYDMTPVTVPHTHKKDLLSNFNTYLGQTYEISDLILYGGENAKNDSDKYQKELGLTPLNSCVLKWGSDIVSKELTEERVEKVFEKYGIQKDFILTVGTLQLRKNHELLYDAWLEMIKTQKDGEKIPQLVICGNKGWKIKEFMDILENDERIKNKVIWITPSDDELDALYQTCKFTVLPSVYEGWSLTLPESLNYGKFCLTADTPSLTETGKDIVDYANPYDPVEWAEKIRFYYNNPNALAGREELIRTKWSNPTWAECAQKMSKVLDKIMQKEEVQV